MSDEKKCFISCWLNICERNKKCCSFHAKSFHYVMLGHAHKCACADVAVILLLLALLVGGPPTLPVVYYSQVTCMLP